LVEGLCLHVRIFPFGGESAKVHDLTESKLDCASATTETAKMLQQNNNTNQKKEYLKSLPATSTTEIGTGKEKKKKKKKKKKEERE
jgi:hypothetical protein